MGNQPPGSGAPADFPLDFEFRGNLASMARQVGNAVPVLLAQRFGTASSRTLDIVSALNRSERVRRWQYFALVRGRRHAWSPADRRHPTAISELFKNAHDAYADK